MRITILGATGLLGQALMKQAGADQVTGLGSADADIRDPQQVARVLAPNVPDWIILAAAYTDVDGCEKDPSRAFSVNTEGAENVARAARQLGSRILLLSTDYVFDGEKSAPYEIDDARGPLNVYGRTKAEAEDRVAAVVRQACIVRTSWLFGRGGKCFPATILRLAETSKELAVVADQQGSPTYADHLAGAIFRLCRAEARGVVHVTNSGSCSWFEFAQEIVAQSAAPAVVRPVTSTEFPRPARRPRYSVLSPRSLVPFEIHMPSWQEALRSFLFQSRR